MFIAIVSCLLTSANAICGMLKVEGKGQDGLDFAKCIGNYKLMVNETQNSAPVYEHTQEPYPFRKIFKELRPTPGHWEISSRYFPNEYYLSFYYSIGNRFNLGTLFYS